MKASELIKKLQAIIDNHNDLEVLRSDHEFDFTPINNIKIYEFVDVPDQNNDPTTLEAIILT